MRPMRISRSVCLGIAAVVTALSLTACSDDGPGDSDDSTSDAGEESSGGSLFGGGSDDEAMEEVEGTGAEEDTSGELLEIGGTASVGAWDVTVTEVETDATEILGKSAYYNEDASGQYLLVTYEATYTGSERMGDVDVDLTWSLTGADSQVYESTYATTPAEDESWPSEARAGGTVRQQAVFDLPPEQADGGILTVESYDDELNLLFADFQLD